MDYYFDVLLPIAADDSQHSEMSLSFNKLIVLYYVTKACQILKRGYIIFILISHVSHVFLKLRFWFHQP